MKRLSTLLSVFVLSGTVAALVPVPVMAQGGAQNPYPLGPDSQVQPGVPKGEVLHFAFEKSRVFPGTFRDYWIYVPAQYSPDKPACLYVNQDGVQWNAPVVFDNLIAKKEIPVTIGVFVQHGRVKANDPKVALDRFNRSYEYDGLGSDYARFLLEELLPEVETKKTADGRAIHFSHEANDHAIGGSSSGAICAFTAAWERPDAFSRVFSAIGTYVGLRGGDRYPTLIRKYEPKPLRVFLQDGSNDQNIYAGDWWMANQMMERALTFAGYEVQHAWGELGHDGRQGAAIFPDVMRYLWKDWPQAVKVGHSRNSMLNEILAPDEEWQIVDNASVPRDTFSSSRRVTAHNGDAYESESANGSKPQSRLFLNHSGKRRRSVDDAVPGDANALTLSSDQTLLYVADSRTQWVYSYKVQTDGNLTAGQRYYWLHTPDDNGESGASGMCVDRDGRLYVATRLGIQVCDQAGRVNVILPLPGGGAAQNIAFGEGEADRSTLYATDGTHIYRRKLKAIGTSGKDESNRPASPRL